MSVDTYLKGKRMTGRYDRMESAGVTVLVARTLSSWATGARLDMGGIPPFRRLKPVVDHRHHPT